MQTAALGVLAWELTESNSYLGYMVFATLGPLGLLSLVGGSLADTADRRTIILVTQAWQMIGTFVLAALVIDDSIDSTLLLALVFVMALGQGIFAPTFTSIVPSLAGPQNLQAAIALNSIQVNVARVIGPAVGGFLTSVVGFAEVFFINGVTYLAVLWAVWVTDLPSPKATNNSLSDRLFGGFRIAARAPQVGRPLLTMMLFSLLCLPFIAQLPAIAEQNLGVDAASTEYGWFYGIFGAGALVGAILVGTVLVTLPKPFVARATLFGFAVTLAWLTALSSITIAYAAVFSVGLFYFVLPTTLNTIWQEHAKDSVRGRIAALWVLSFGGTVPFAGLISGQIIEVTTLRAVMYGGVVAAILLAVLMRLPEGDAVGEEILADPA